MQAKHKLIKTKGSYDSQAHLGKGKDQKLTPPAVGDGYNRPTPHTGSAIVRDGAEGKGGPKRGYQQDAHTPIHHGRGGEAVGHKNDFHMNYDATLYSEGRATSEGGTGPTFVPKHEHANKGSKVATHPLGHSTKAEHHPPVSGTPHGFNRVPAKEAHGYGYMPSQKSGHLRMSGHGKGHQVGKR